MAQLQAYSFSQLELLKLFVNRFVRKPYQSRFLHEATKKPGKLASRIHRGEEKVFDPKYRVFDLKSKLRTAPFRDDDICWILVGWYNETPVTTWKEVKEIISRGGGEFLVIKMDASAFYAESEGFPPRIIHAGSI